MKKFFDILDLAIVLINKNMAVLGLTLGVLLAFVNVVLRYAFDMSLTWAGELTNYCFIWSALFAAAYGFKKGVHISVTILLNLFPPIVAKSLLIFANLISVAYLLIISYFGYELIVMLMEFGEMSVDLNIPTWIPHLVIPIAFLFAGYRAAEKVYELSMMDTKDVLKNTEHEIILD